MLSLLPNMEMKTVWEAIIQPMCSGLMMVWFEPSRVNDPNKSSAYANGAFIIITRKAYDAVGGHEAIKYEIQEDIVLARNVKRAGEGLEVRLNSGLFAVRMYTSFTAILRGWIRIFYGSFGGVGKLLISIVAVLLMGNAPVAAAAIGFAMVAGGGTTMWWICAITGAAAFIMQMSVLYRFYALVPAKKWFWTYSFSNFLMIGMLAASLLKHLSRSRMTWKGTTYSR
jgi:hypothetical protein